MAAAVVGSKVSVDLALVEDLEAQLAAAVGEDRRPLRRKLRNARRGAGVSMTRVRSVRAKKASGVRIEGETPEDAIKRLQASLRAVSCKPKKGLRDGWAFPVDFPAEIILAKYLARTGYEATEFDFIAGPPALVVLQ